MDMRIVYVWITVCVSLGIITFGWYVSATLVTSLVNAALGDVSSQAFSVITIIEYAAAWWGPIFDALVIVWGIYASQEQSAGSVIYG